MEDSWSADRLNKTLIDSQGRLKPFPADAKQALFGLDKQEALLLEPRLYSLWKNFQSHEFHSKGGKTSAKKRKELKDWSLKVRTLLANPDLTATMVNQRKLPKWFNGLEYDEDNMPEPSEVIAATLIAKAMNGDVRAIEELRKLGWGDKITLDSTESFFNKSSLQVEIVNPSKEQKELEAKEFGQVKTQDDSQSPAESPQDESAKGLNSRDRSSILDIVARK